MIGKCMEYCGCIDLKRIMSVQDHGVVDTRHTGMKGPRQQSLKFVEYDAVHRYAMDLVILQAVAQSSGSKHILHGQATNVASDTMFPASLSSLNRVQ